MREQTSSVLTDHHGIYHERELNVGHSETASTISASPERSDFSGFWRDVGDYRFDLFRDQIYRGTISTRDTRWVFCTVTSVTTASP